MKDGVLKLMFWGSYFYFSFLLLLITLQYVPYNSDVAFLRIKQDVVIHDYYKVAFFIHVYTSIFLMVLGAIQFILPITYKTKKIHRYSGRLYVLIILFLSGPSGLVMSYHANGGIFAQMAFLILSFLWMGFTGASIYYAMTGLMQKHQIYALRSFALTLSAISLRLFKFLIVYFFDLQSMDAYRIVAWLGWGVNLIIVEIIIYRRLKKTNISSAQKVHK